LRGRVPIHMGQGAGLPSYVIGQAGGAEQVTLTQNTIPAHTHSLTGSGAAASATIPTNQIVAQTNKNLYRAGPAGVPTAAAAVGLTGGSQPHDNVQPFLCLNFIISLYGIYPSRP
jgi:microcystin-dependent protein